MPVFCEDCHRQVTRAAARCRPCHNAFIRLPKVVREAGKSVSLRPPGIGFAPKPKPVDDGLSPFERQERALMRGAKLVPNNRLYSS